MPPPLKERERTDDDADGHEVDFPEFDKKPAFIHVVLLNKTIRLFFILGVAAIVVPAFAYLFFFSQEIGHAPKQQLTGTCGHPTLYHIQCGLTNISKEECHFLGCCYTSLSTCYHTLPSEHQYRTLDADWHSGASLVPTRNVTPYHKRAVPEIQIHLTVLQQSRISLSLSATRRELPAQQSVRLVQAGDLQVKIYSPTFFVEVKNLTSDAIIFSTARGPLIVSEDFFEWTLHLGVDSMFGLGEAVLEPGEKYLLLNNQNLSTVPVVMGYNHDSRQYNGVIFTTPGLTEIEIIRSRLLVVRSQFRGSFQLELLSGPNPEDLHRQLKAINQNQYTPPFWSYGVHVCDHSRSVNLDSVFTDIQHLSGNGTIFDSHCINDNLFWLSNPVAISGTLQQIMDLLKLSNKRFIVPVVMLLEPTSNAAYKNATYADLLLRSSSRLGPYRGVARNRTVTYVDWRTERNELGAWVKDVWEARANMNPDGYSLKETALRDDGNKTFPSQSQLTYLPESLNASLREGIAWNVRFPSSLELVIKSQNRIGPETVRAVQQLTGEDALLITGSYNLRTRAAVLSQNVSASWISLRHEVNQAIGLSIAGISFTGTPICGNANDNVTEELCIRWYQFGSLLPLFKVSADRTPNRFSRFAMRIMQATVRNRFALLEYFNTLLVTDAAYLRPMFYHYEEARNYTAELWEQFMVGDSLLVVPVLLPQMTQLDIYFPEPFYELWAGEKLPQTKERPMSYTVVESDLPMFVRPGRLVGLREVADGVLGVDEVRRRPIFLIGALACRRVSSCNASGRLAFARDFEIEFSVLLEVQLTLQLNLKLSNNGTTAAQLCADNFAGNVTFIQLYGHPNRTGSTVEQFDYDLCNANQTTEFQFPNNFPTGETLHE